MANSATAHSNRVLDCSGDGTLSGVVTAWNWVADNAKPKSVVNLSLADESSSALDAAVTSLVDDGIPVVAAAGNKAVDACEFSPGSAGPAITVGAADRTDAEASLSNYGSCLDSYAQEWASSRFSWINRAGTGPHIWHFHGSAACGRSSRNAVIRHPIAQR